jgi:hypothetical protein
MSSGATCLTLPNIRLIQNGHVVGESEVPSPGNRERNSQASWPVRTKRKHDYSEATDG